MPLVTAMLLVGLTTACVNRLPDQDLRILSAVPTSRLSADVLWRDYRDRKSQADKTYFRQPIVISGLVTAQGSGAPGDRYVFFGQTEKNGIRANLLDEQADEILKNVPPDKRVTLKCFCEGLRDDVVLKSCVRP